MSQLFSCIPRKELCDAKQCFHGYLLLCRPKGTVRRRGLLRSCWRSGVTLWHPGSWHSRSYMDFLGNPNSRSSNPHTEPDTRHQCGHPGSWYGRCLDSFLVNPSRLQTDERHVPYFSFLFSFASSWCNFGIQVLNTFFLLPFPNDSMSHFLDQWLAPREKEFTNYNYKYILKFDFLHNCLNGAAK